MHSLVFMSEKNEGRVIARPLQKEDVMSKKKAVKKVTAKAPEKEVPKKGLLNVKSVHPIFNKSGIKGLPLRIPCGWTGMISRNTYEVFGGDGGHFIILEK